MEEAWGRHGGFLGQVTSVQLPAPCVELSRVSLTQWEGALCVLQLL